MDIKILIREAEKCRENAYSPYSNFKVGAAVLCSDGRIFTGCNVENASFGATNCAERTAIFKAVSEGCRDIKAIAVIGDTENYTYPCGICRQVMVEFSDQDMTIIIAKNEEDYIIEKLNNIIPGAFSKKDLDERKNN